MLLAHVFSCFLCNSPFTPVLRVPLDVFRDVPKRCWTSGFPVMHIGQHAAYLMIAKQWQHKSRPGPPTRSQRASCPDFTPTCSSGSQKRLNHLPLCTRGKQLVSQVITQDLWLRNVWTEQRRKDAADLFIMLRWWPMEDEQEPTGQLWAPHTFSHSTPALTLTCPPPPHGTRRNPPESHRRDMGQGPVSQPSIFCGNYKFQKYSISMGLEGKNHTYQIV